MPAPRTASTAGTGMRRACVKRRRAYASTQQRDEAQSQHQAVRTAAASRMERAALAAPKQASCLEMA